MTAPTRRIDKLIQRLQSRTKADGTPLPGYTQNVAQIRAEIEQLTRADEIVEKSNGKKA